MQLFFMHCVHKKTPGAIRDREMIKIGLTERRRGAERETIKAEKNRIGYFNRTSCHVRYRYRINPKRLGMYLRHRALANGAFVITPGNDPVSVVRRAVVDRSGSLTASVMMLMEYFLAEQQAVCAQEKN